MTPHFFLFLNLGYENLGTFHFAKKNAQCFRHKTFVCSVAQDISRARMKR